MNDIIALRRQLHRYPEISNQEFSTAVRIHEFMMKLLPDKSYELGATGRAYVFESEVTGPTVLFRAELDALAIQENSENRHCSRNQGIAHACGHDGHMAIVAALAKKVAEKRPRKGKVVMLFQPAEEIEQGAFDVINDKNFVHIEPDYVFALHNIPGAPKGEILIKNGSFAAASKGLTVKLIGRTSHAAEPEKGISPTNAIAIIIEELHELRANKSLFNDFILLTIINIQLGEIAFGTSPGYAEMRITLRTFENQDMELLTQMTQEVIERVAQEEKLKTEFQYSEVFPAVVNDPECVEIIKEAATENNLKLSELDAPFKWSEDFSYYSQKYKGGYFGLGAGKNQPALHHPNFDFPDDIIEVGAELFFSIYKSII